MAMLEKSKQTTGLQLSYMEFSTLAVSIIGNEVKSVFCVTFYDISDGEEFGSLMASEVLKTFLNMYQSELTKSGGLNPNLFQDFQFNLGGIIRDASKPVLDDLSRNRAVAKVLLVKEDPRVGDSAIIHATGEVDQFGVLANLKPLASTATDIMALRHDTATTVWLESSPSRASRVLVRRIVKGTYLVAQFSKRFDFSHYCNELDKATRLLEKVCTMSEMMKR